MDAESEKILSRLRHDLRTPINQIIGFAEILSEDIEDEDSLTYLGYVVKAARDQLGKLSGALDMAVELGRASADGTSAAPALESDAARQLLEESHEEATFEPPPPTDLPEPAEDAEKVLIVDDNPQNRELLRVTLARKGYRVDQVPSGEQALAQVPNGDYDLVLLDIMMPGISGIEVLKQLRLTLSADALPVIMTTARDASDDIVEALALGANDYVTKPIDQAVLLARMETHLDIKRSTIQIRELAEQLRKRNAFIRQTFGRYTNEEVVQSLIDEPTGLELGGESRTITVVMSDLRGFSTISERLPPQQVMKMLNTYLGIMSEIIAEHQGTIDEIIGDAILVFFGAPTKREDDAERAVACALAMQAAMDQVNEAVEELDLPPLQMGIGINTGEVVVGNIGSQRRAKYGAVGRNINLAARIESFTLGGQVLISESTRDAIKAELRVDDQTTLNPKGARAPMRLFEVGGIGAPWDVQLPRLDERVFELDRPEPIEFVVLDGAHIPDARTAGVIRALSVNRAHIESTEPARQREVVRLTMLDRTGSAMDGSIVGRTVEADDSGFVLHFTAVDGKIEDALHRLAIMAETRA